MQSIPKMQEVGGVGVCYLPQALLLPQEHAIALTMGHIIIWLQLVQSRSVLWRG